jgi:ATP/maltotriose-dependent transcriptional regulator MalT
MAGPARLAGRRPRGRTRLRRTWRWLSRADTASWNAAAWCEEHGLADEAVRHALAAGDTTWAALLIERHFDETFWPGERATVQRWLSALPAELAGSRPRLCLVRAILALASGDAEGAGPLLDAAERASADVEDEPLEPSAGQAASLLVNVPAAIALCGASLAELRVDADGTAAFRVPGPSQTAAAVPGLVEQLTDRELEILVLLAAGTPNPRIPGELVITGDTVKKHVSHLLAKPGAANRTEAVTRARQLGLIP